MCDFEVVSYNVNGLGDDRKRRKIFNCMKKSILLGKQLYFFKKLIQSKKSKSYLNTNGEVKCFSVMVLLVVEGSAFASGMTLIATLLKSLMIKTVGILSQEWRYRASLTF